jgi:hypothetical protein
MNYLKYKKDQVGICNICLKNRQLSWDHVPPKGGIDLTKVEMETILQKLSKNNLKVFKESQNGVKYRTICKECNEMLGSKYDKVINEFSNAVSNYLNSSLILPEVIHHKTKPIILMRAILGHLLSAKVEIDEIEFDEIVRGFIFNENILIPDKIKIFYWIYPYKQTVVIRDCMMPARRGHFSDFELYHIIKHFPMAYLITESTHYEGLPELTKYRSMDFNEEVDIPIYLKRIEHPDWPEIVDNGNIFVGGQSTRSSIVAKPKIKNR